MTHYPMHKSLDLNCDVGEIAGARDRSLLPFVSSCNVSCGIHAGDPVLITATLREALRLGVALGAHPSYPDREYFGRQTMDLPQDQLADHLRYQISAIHGMASSLGGQLSHVKPHGALYHDVAKNKQLASTLADVVKQLDPTIAIYGQAETLCGEVYQEQQLRFIPEVFADRRYESATTLRDRSLADAVLEDADDFQQQLQNFLKGSVVDRDQNRHAVSFETICLHSDTPRAQEFAQQAHQIFKENHVRMAAP